jgi:putative flippase GtrA
MMGGVKYAIRSLFVWGIHKFRELFLYGIVGLVITVLGWGLYLFLTRIVGLYYLVANVIGTPIMILISFFSNKYIVFSAKETDTKKELVLFVLSQGVFFLVDTGIMYVLVTLIGVFDIYAKITSSVIVILGNFFCRKFIIFRKKNCAA